jgi:hypothetical protein
MSTVPLLIIDQKVFRSCLYFTERLDHELVEALARAGFSEVWRLPWSAWPDQHEEPAMDRNLWCARKGGGEASVRPARLRGLGFRHVR